MKWYIKIGLLICLAGMLSAQSLTRLEQMLNEQTRRLKQQQAISDSLKQELQKLTARLEEEKSRSEPNEKQLKSLMAEIVDISQKLERSHQQEATLQTALEKTRHSLEVQYSHKIDSLKTMLQSGHFVKEQGAIKQEMLRYQEKRLTVSPPLPGLHFDPRTIIEINPNAARDSTERLFYTDYLRNALGEVQQHLKQLKLLRRDYLAAWQLRRRTRNFVDDVTSEGHITVMSVAPSRNISLQDAERYDFSSLKTGMPDFPSPSQTQSILSLYDQLEPHNRWHALSLESEQPALTPEEYLNLLDRTIRELQHYREIITGKLKKAGKRP